MGNLETALSQAPVHPTAILEGGLSEMARGSSQDSGRAAKSGVGVDLHGNNSNNPNTHHQTSATSIPVSVPEVESETDVGAPSPSLQERGPWGSFSPPGETELLCPTPFHSTSIDQEPSVRETYNLYGPEHLACLGNAVGRALALDKDSGGASSGAPQCPHIAAAALERQNVIPPSLLALNEIIKDSMGCPQIPGLHLNSPSDSPRWKTVPRPPQGSPVTGVSDKEPSGVPKRKLKEAGMVQRESSSAVDSTREVSQEDLPVSEGCLRSTGGSSDEAQGTHEKNSTRNPSEGNSYNTQDDREELVKFCCAHIVSMHGRVESSNRTSNSRSSGSSAIDRPMQALQQLSPCLHECSEAISRTMLAQSSSIGAPLAGSSEPSVGFSSGSLSVNQARPASDASLGEVSSTLQRLQVSIDQFTAVLSRCEGRLLSALYGGTHWGPSLPLGASWGLSRGSSMGALELGGGSWKGSGAPSSNGTTRAQQGSPLGPKDLEEEGPLTPIFLFNREAATPVSDSKMKNTLGAEAPLNQAVSLQQQHSSVNMGFSFSPPVSEGPSRRLSKGVSDALSSDRSTDSTKGTETKKTRRGPGRAIRWAKERLKGIMPKPGRRTTNA